MLIVEALDDALFNKRELERKKEERKNNRIKYVESIRQEVYTYVLNNSRGLERYHGIKVYQNDKFSVRCGAVCFDIDAKPYVLVIMCEELVQQIPSDMAGTVEERKIVIHNNRYYNNKREIIIQKETNGYVNYQNNHWQQELLHMIVHDLVKELN